jgi:methionine biosynthesis protein MetW
MSAIATDAHTTGTHAVLGRTDYALISELIEPRSHVLDLGCGDGALLHWLAENKRVEARGVELDPALVRKAISRGVSAYQSDIDSGLADYPDLAFDYVILSQTLQEVRHPLRVLREMLRVGRRAIISFPNYGHWRVRIEHVRSGRAPRTRLFPYNWYDSPNIHFLTILDFEDLIRGESWNIERRLFTSGQRQVRLLPNLMAEVGVYLIRR